MEIQLQPPAPQMPDLAPQFRGMDPAAAVEQTAADAAAYTQLLDSRKKPSPAVWIAGTVCTVAGIGLLILTKIWLLLLLGVLVTALGIALQQNCKNKNKQLETRAQMIARKYVPLELAQWTAEAKQYADTKLDYETQLNDYRNRMQQLNGQYKVILNQLDAVTGGLVPSRYEQETEIALQQHRAYADALRECSRLEETVATLESTHREVLPPQEPDVLTFNLEQTDRLISDTAAEIRHLHQRLGQCQGRMESLGDPEMLRGQLNQITARIAELEKYYSATVLAQELLLKAKQELQRRFAPRISQRAQDLFATLTGGRYQKIALAEDFALSTAAEDEDTLRGSLWRSDGTADQMYLALRLAVAEELTPDAPLILDDAFVRFDDERLKEALQILNQTGAQKQVILFTCQSRETKIMEELL